MMKRVAGSLSYANVMSTLAVFLVLGGGVTLAAISGNGSVKFGAAKGLPLMEWKTVLSLPGVGKVQAYCAKGTEIRFKNTSGGSLQASVLRLADPTFDAASLADGDSLGVVVLGFAEFDDIDTLRFHVFKASGSGKPTADITVSHRYGPAGCEQRAVAAQTVTSE